MFAHPCLNHVIVLTDALKQSPRPTHIVTEGGIQSNHVRQVAAAAAKLGFESTTLLISDRVPDRSSTASSSDAYASRCYTELGNVQLTELMGANHVTDADTDTTIGKTKEEIMKKHLGAYFIPSGASTHPLGGLGYARWAYEVEQQELEMAERFDVVVVALNSGSTLAGMLAGFALAEQERKKRGQNSRAKRVIGVLTTPIDDLEAMKRLVVDIANATGEKIGLDGKSVITADDFKIDDRWHGGAYGRLDERTKESIKLAVRTEALVTDPVYSGKALTGLCEMVKMGEITGNALFVHTGGVMSLSAYPDLR